MTIVPITIKLPSNGIKQITPIHILEYRNMLENGDHIFRQLWASFTIDGFYHAIYIGNEKVIVLRDYHYQIISIKDFMGDKGYLFRIEYSCGDRNLAMENLNHFFNGTFKINKWFPWFCWMGMNNNEINLIPYTVEINRTKK